MPKQTLPIGTYVENCDCEQGVVIGQKFTGLDAYHLYLIDSGVYCFCHRTTLQSVKPATPTSISIAQDAILHIAKRPILDAQIQIGTTIISKSVHGLPAVEYIILDNGQYLNNGEISHLTAFRTYDSKTWLLGYTDISRFLGHHAHITIYPPNDQSIRKAKELFFERVISPAFTI